MRRWVLIVAACLALGLSVEGVRAEPDTPTITTVELRGGLGSVKGALQGVDDQGVRLGGRPTLAWSVVRTVRGRGAEEARAFSGVADQAWRGLSRLRRGDPDGAEPLLERLFEQYRNGDGATTRVVAEGLVACRLGRNGHAGAVEPWTVAVHAARGPLATSALLAEAVAGEGGHGRLIPSLAPIWTDTPAVRALVDRPGVPFQEGSVAGRLDELYKLAAAWAIGRVEAVALEQGFAADDPELRFVEAVVFAQIGDDAARATARAELAVTIEGGVPAWAEAWARVAMGRSLLAEASREDQLLGIAELLRVPAALQAEQPYLAGLALSEAVQAADRLGMGDGADRLEDEFQRAFPGHPGGGVVR